MVDSAYHSSEIESSGSNRLIGSVVAHAIDGSPIPDANTFISSKFWWPGPSQ